MFTHYDGTRDWFGIILFSVLGIVALLFIWGATVSGARMEKQQEEKKAYKAKCIDAGGAPVAPFDYVKGHGEGYLCINPSAIIEVE